MSTMPPISSFGSAPVMIFSSPAARTPSIQSRKSRLAIPHPRRRPLERGCTWDQFVEVQPPAQGRRRVAGQFELWRRWQIHAADSFLIQRGRLRRLSAIMDLFSGFPDLDLNMMALRALERPQFKAGTLGLYTEKPYLCSALFAGRSRNRIGVRRCRLIRGHKTHHASVPVELILKPC